MADNLIDDPVKAKDNAYWERNQLVSALSKLFPAHLAQHDINDKEWEDDWRNIVVIWLPYPKDSIGEQGGGRGIPVTWHIHDHDMPMFDHLMLDSNYYWDGHNTQEKYHRLRQLIKPIKEEK